MMIQAAAYALAKRVGTFVLGGFVLWQVAEHSGPSHSRAIVHVSFPHVDLIVDQESYRVEDLAQSPIVCELRPGRHTVRLRRDGVVRHQEEFNLAAGEEIVLAACEPHIADPTHLPPRRRGPRRP